MIKGKKGIIEIKNEKGSITVFVLVTMLFLVTVLFLSYMGMSNKVINTEKQVNKIQEEYSSKDENKFDEEYEKAANTTKSYVGTTKSYVGYYADIDADGTVDGVIYADLAKGDNVEKKWNNNSNSNYTIPTVTEGLKDYYISKTNYKANEGFGTKDVISPTGTGKDRFYIMALTDIDGKRNGTHYDWYNAAYVMSDYATTTSGDFGKGKSNTTTMIAKWNAKAYGDQDKCSLGHKDMWGQIQEKVNNGWFVPSKAEWSAFGGELGISDDSSNEKYYGNFGLSLFYWSSSQYDASSAWYAYFTFGSMYSDSAFYNYCVRLSTTF